jgi:hypothetical protein
MDPQLHDSSRRWDNILARRRNDYDVTDSVRVSSPSEVCQAVYEIYKDLYPEASFKPLSKAFLDFQRLFSGEYPGYVGCDTVYHDIQHTMDMTLANARLIAGYERSVPLRDQIGPRRFTVSLITALFHDSGYIRHESETGVDNGAELTSKHVSRGADFLSAYLMAQMADRCYLEKCRDRLYPEFVLAGIAVSKDGQGRSKVTYSSGDDLVNKTRDFYYQQVRKRLDKSFCEVHEYFSGFFGGSNPYQAAIDKSIGYLNKTANDDAELKLRRQPPVFTSEDDSLDTVRTLVQRRLDT